VKAGDKKLVSTHKPVKCLFHFHSNVECSKVKPGDHRKVTRPPGKIPAWGHGSHWVKLGETNNVERLILPLPELYAFIKGAHGNDLRLSKQWSMLIIRGRWLKAHLIRLQHNTTQFQTQTDHED
jgi:hypothetical protein